MQMLTPQYNVKREIYNKVIYENWPKDIFREISDLDSIKKFYNDCYNTLKSDLEIELNKYHPAAWILEGYKQLELWTVIYYDDPVENVSGHKDFAPIGRYGWRFIIDVCLEKLKPETDFNQDRPNLDSINTVFTLLLGMGQCSEYSNYLHFLKNKLTTTKIVFSPNLLIKDPEFGESDKELFNNIKNTILKKTDWEKYDHFAPNSEILTKQVELFLIKHFSISLDEIHRIIESIIDGICNITQASITVQPLDDFIQIVNELSGVSIDKVKSLIEISFLNIENENHRNRDFLRKSQQVRMLFNAGVILKLESHFETIYDSKSAKEEYIIASKEHVIISPRLYAEWLDVFITKIVLGQRTDLKNNSRLKQDIIDIESFYRIKVFEKEVTKMLSNFNFHCINLSKFEGEDIECGEIDIIGFNLDTNELFIVECKAYAPIVDARGLGQVLNDHYKQKKYHKKFIKKIKWVEEDKNRIKQIFKNRCDIDISDDYKTLPYFITSSNSTLNLIEDKYEIMTFYEFDNFLKNGLR